MKIKEDLVYDRHTGEPGGFIDLDKTDNELLALEHALLNENSKLAKYMWVVMVRGACSDFTYTLVCYATDGIKAEFMDTDVWEAVEVLVWKCCFWHVIKVPQTDGLSTFMVMTGLCGTRKTWRTLHETLTLYWKHHT